MCPLSAKSTVQTVMLVCRVSLKQALIKAKIHLLNVFVIITPPCSAPLCPIGVSIDYHRDDYLRLVLQ